MLTYLERYQLVSDAAFRKRIQLALWVVCLDVMDENVNVQNHAARVVKASALLKGEADPDTMRMLALRLMANATIGDQGAAVEDSAIKNAVANNFNSLL